MRDCARICRYLHVPVQSGSDRILKMMNRGYTSGQYRDFIDRARAMMPDISIASDFIVGFPTETEEDFAASADLLRYCRFKNSFIFKYSPRPGTTAIERFPDDVAEEIKRRRNNDLLAVQQGVAIENNRAMNRQDGGADGGRTEQTRDTAGVSVRGRRGTWLGAAIGREEGGHGAAHGAHARGSDRRVQRRRIDDRRLRRGRDYRGAESDAVWPRQNAGACSGGVTRNERSRVRLSFMPLKTAPPSLFDFLSQRTLLFAWGIVALVGLPGFSRPPAATSQYERMLYALGAFPVGKLTKHYYTNGNPGKVYSKGDRIDVDGWLPPFWAADGTYLTDAEKSAYGIPKAALRYDEYISMLDIVRYKQTRDPELFLVMRFALDELGRQRIAVKKSDVLRVYEAQIDLEPFARPLLAGASVPVKMQCG